MQHQSLRHASRHRHQFRFCRWCKTRSYIGGGRCANDTCRSNCKAGCRVCYHCRTWSYLGGGRCANHVCRRFGVQEQVGAEHGAEWRHWPVRTQEPATPTVCTCGFCGAHWMQWGWRCDHAGVAYMASGRRVNSYQGARLGLAESLGVPPGLLCRRANTMVVAKTSGFLMSPAWEIDCRVLERESGFCQWSITPT